MKQLLLVFLGGGIGSSLRFWISRYLLNNDSSIPLGTFTVNVLGCLFIGLFLGLALKNNLVSQNMMLLFATGFCGGFTTFSAFAQENYILLKTGDITSFVVYTAGSLILGLIAVLAGIWVSKLF